MRREPASSDPCETSLLPPEAWKRLCFLYSLVCCRFRSSPRRLIHFSFWGIKKGHRADSAHIRKAKHWDQDLTVSNYSPLCMHPHRWSRWQVHRQNIEGTQWIFTGRFGAMAHDRSHQGMKKGQSLRHTRGGRWTGLLWSNCSTFHKIWLELVIQLLKTSQENAIGLLE